MLVDLIILLFAPGFAICEVLGIYAKDDSLSVKLAFIIGVSMSVSILALGASNILGPISYMVVRVLEGASLGASLAIALLNGRGLHIIKMPKRTDLIVLALVAFMGVLTFLIFQKYPIFPAYSDTDYLQNTQVVQGMLVQANTFSSAALYFGIDFLLAAGAVGSSGVPIETIRIGMAVITVLSPLIVYGLAERVWDRATAVMAAAIYVLPGFIWVNIVYNSGTWANFTGILLSAFALMAFVSFPKIGKLGAAFMTLIVLGGLAFSHYTSVFVIPSLVAIGLLSYWKKEDGCSVYLGPSVIIIGMVGGLMILLRDSLVPFLISQTTTVETLATNTVLGAALPTSSFQSMVSVFDDDLGFVMLGALTLLGFFIELRERRNIGGLAMVIWLVPMFFLSLVTNDWRFSYIVMVPMLYFSADGLNKSLNKLTTFNFSSRLTGKRTKIDVTQKTIWAVLIIMLVFATGSRGAIAIQDATTYQSPLAQDQQATYQMMQWTGTHLLGNVSIGTDAWQFAAYYATTEPQSHATAYYLDLQSVDDVFNASADGITYFALVNETISGSTLQELNVSQRFDVVWDGGLAQVYHFNSSVA